MEFESYFSFFFEGGGKGEGEVVIDIDSTSVGGGVLLIGKIPQVLGFFGLGVILTLHIIRESITYPLQYRVELMQLLQLTYTYTYTYLSR